MHHGFSSTMRWASEMTHMQRIVQLGAQLIGASFVEFVPERDPGGHGATAIARLASNLIAAVGRQRGPTDK